MIEKCFPTPVQAVRNTIYCSDHQKNCAIASTTNSKFTKEAKILNAEYIAMCVNNHDELVAALERVDRLLSTIQSVSNSDSVICLQIDRNKIAAVLAKVKA